MAEQKQRVLDEFLNRLGGSDTPQPAPSAPAPSAAPAPTGSRAASETIVKELRDSGYEEAAGLLASYSGGGGDSSSVRSQAGSSDTVSSSPLGDKVRSFMSELESDIGGCVGSGPLAGRPAAGSASATAAVNSSGGPKLADLHTTRDLDYWRRETEALEARLSLES